MNKAVLKKHTEYPAGNGMSFMIDQNIIELMKDSHQVTIVDVGESYQKMAKKYKEGKLYL